MIRDLVAIFGVIGGFTYYALTVRNAQRTRELTLKAQEQAIESRNTQFLIQMHKEITNEEGIKIVFSDKTWDTFDEWWEMYGPINNPDAFSKWFKMILAHETIGLLLKRDFLDIEVIDDLMSGAILMTWDRYEAIIDGLRERYGYPQLQEHQEYLANEIRKIVKNQHPDFEGKRLT